MNQLWQLIQNVPMQVWILIAVFGFSVIGQIGKSLTTVKQKRKLEIERQKRSEESMRTGRPVPDPAQAQASEVEERRQRLAEMQQRRQAQLDELRKRRQQMLQRKANAQGQAPAQPQGQSPTRARSQPQARIAPPVGGPAGSPGTSLGTSPGTSPVPVRARTPMPRPVAAPPHSGSHSVLQASGLGLPKEPMHSTVHASESLGSLEKRHLESGFKAFEHAGLDVRPASQTGLKKHGIHLKGHEDLRRAIILSEILAKPVSVRLDRLAEFE